MDDGWYVSRPRRQSIERSWKDLKDASRKPQQANTSFVRARTLLVLD